jgi:hypothetical protein
MRKPAAMSEQTIASMIVNLTPQADFVRVNATYK